MRSSFIKLRQRKTTFRYINHNFSLKVVFLFHTCLGPTIYRISRQGIKKNKVDGVPERIINNDKIPSIKSFEFLIKKIKRSYFMYKKLLTKILNTSLGRGPSLAQWPNLKNLSGGLNMVGST